MNIEALILCAIEESLEELERDNIIRLNNTNILRECSVCFESHVSNNTKELSCKKHFSCTECWYNYVRSRIGIDTNSDRCFICFPRESLLTSTTYEEYEHLPILDQSILTRIIPYASLFMNRMFINSVYYYNQLRIRIYQANFKYLETNEDDVIINLVNNRYMFHKYGLALTLYEKAKHTFGPESLTWVKNNGILPINGIAVTNGGFIKAKIIHCNSPNPAGKDFRVLRNYLELCYINVFEKILTMDNVKRIYLPGIFARRVEENDDRSIQIAVMALFSILTIYIYDLKQKGIKEINIIDYGKNPKILAYLSNVMENALFI